MARLRQWLGRASLKARLGLLVSALLGLFGLALSGLALLDARNSVHEEIEAASKVSHQLLGLLVEREAQSAASLLPVVQRLGRVRAQELVLFDAAGVEHYRSPPSPYKVGRAAPHWFAELLTPPLQVQQLRFGDETLRIVADPSRAVLDAWDELLILFTGLAVFLLVVNILLRRLVERSLGGLDQVERAMAAMAQGRLDARLPAQPLPELVSLCRAFNHMAAALEASQRENGALTQEQELARRTEQRLDDERRAIARELHDELGQCITAIRSIALVIARSDLPGRPDIADNAQRIAEVAASMYDAVHAIVARLRPAALVRLGLADGLQQWLASWQLGHPGRDLQLAVRGELKRVDAALEVAVLRIVQEAINNAVKHTQARLLQVNLDAEADRLTLTVEDDGGGFAPRPAGREAEATAGFGLTGMRERASELGGWLDIDSVCGRGTRLTACFPI
jgi:two-component system sensor histidine kinase UhpB